MFCCKDYFSPSVGISSALALFSCLQSAARETLCSLSLIDGEQLSAILYSPISHRLWVMGWHSAKST